MNEDFITRLRGQLVDAAGRTQRPPVLSLAWLRPALVTAAVLAALALFVLPSPFAGFASLACVGAFVTGGVRRINDGDPEMVSRTTRSGIIGGGG